MNCNAHNHLWYAICRDLQDSSDAHDCCTEKDGLLPAKRLANDESQDRTKKASNVVDGRHRTEKRAVVAEVQLVEVVACYDNAAKDALVISEEPWENQLERLRRAILLFWD
jgi:hypothetical protein